MPGVRNVRAAGDARHARTGKDGLFFDKDGNILASVESFTSSATYNNAKYTVLGDGQEHETANTFSVSLTMTQIVVESDKFIKELIRAMSEQEMRVWGFRGSLKGRNGSEEIVVYDECIPSGQIDIQNVSVGDVIKRNWNFFANQAPNLQSELTII